MATPNTLEVTDANFESAVLKSPLPVLVDFWAPWCAPCRALTPHVEALAVQYAGRVVVGKCNIDSSPMAPTQYEVHSIPTLLLFKDGQVRGQLVGPVPKAKIEEMLNKVV